MSRFQVTIVNNFYILARFADDVDIHATQIKVMTLKMFILSSLRKPG